jgi:hypothetical protein
VAAYSCISGKTSSLVSSPIHDLLAPYAFDRLFAGTAVSRSKLSGSGGLLAVIAFVLLATACRGVLAQGAAVGAALYAVAPGETLGAMRADISDNGLACVEGTVSFSSIPKIFATQL